MTGEELFLAIGMVENSRLERSEARDGESARAVEETTGKKGSWTVRRIVRNALVAVLILGMLGVTAYAAAAYLIFDSPEEMVDTIFGDKTGYDHSAGSITTFEDGIGSIVEPTFDRVPVEEEPGAEVAAMVSPVGQTISGNGYTLRVDGNLYDAVTKCGVVTYTLENPEGLDYSLQSDGEVWFPGGEVIRFSQYGYSYIIQDQSTDTRLTAAYYYQLRSENTDLEIGLTQWAEMTVQDYDKWFIDTKQQLKQEVSEEEILEYVRQLTGDGFAQLEAENSRETLIEQGYDTMAYEKMGVLDDDGEQNDDGACITIPAVTSGEMRSMTLGNGAVTLSSVAMCVNLGKIANYPKEFIDVAKIQFADGTEYVVKDGYTENFVFHVSSEDGMDETLMFNRIIDVTEVTGLILDGGMALQADP